MKKIITIILTLCILLTTTYAYNLTKIINGNRLTTTINAGEQVTLTYTDSAGSVFASWTATGITLTNPTNRTQIITMPAGNVTIEANRECWVIYSADDNSLTFTYNANGVVAGGSYNNKTATAVYEDVLTSGYTSSSLVPWYQYRSSIANVIIEEEIAPVSTAYWFYGCSSLTSLDVSKLNTSKVTSMSYMFSGCDGLRSLDVSGFDTSNVTSMSGMFEGCSGLTSLDISNFDISNVTDMSFMFFECSNLVLDFDIGGEYGHYPCVCFFSTGAPGVRLKSYSNYCYFHELI